MLLTPASPHDELVAAYKDTTAVRECNEKLQTVVGDVFGIRVATALAPEVSLLAAILLSTIQRGMGGGPFGLSLGDETAGILCRGVLVRSPLHPNLLSPTATPLVISALPPAMAIARDVAMALWEYTRDRSALGGIRGALQMLQVSSTTASPSLRVLLHALHAVERYSTAIATRTQRIYAKLCEHWRWVSIFSAASFPVALVLQRCPVIFHDVLLAGALLNVWSSLDPLFAILGVRTFTSRGVNSASTQPQPWLAWFRIIGVAIASRAAIRSAALIAAIVGHYYNKRQQQQQGQQQQQQQQQQQNNTTTNAVPATTIESAPLIADNNADAPRCPVCLAPRSHPAVTPCGHVLCWDCGIQACFSNPLCPVCRAPCAPQQLLALQGYR